MDKQNHITQTLGLKEGELFDTLYAISHESAMLGKGKMDEPAIAERFMKMIQAPFNEDTETMKKSLAFFSLLGFLALAKENTGALLIKHVTEQLKNKECDDENE